MEKRAQKQSRTRELIKVSVSDVCSDEISFAVRRKTPEMNRAQHSRPSVDVRAMGALARKTMSPSQLKLDCHFESGIHMSTLTDTKPMTDSTAAFDDEHARTHWRWAIAVLALYGMVGSIGIGAALMQRSTTADAAPPAMQLQANAQMR